MSVVHWKEVQGVSPSLCLQADGGREERGVDHYPQGREGGTVRQSWSGEGRSRSQLAPPTEEVPPPPPLPPPAAGDDADDDMVGLIVLCAYARTYIHKQFHPIDSCLLLQTWLHKV